MYSAKLQFHRNILIKCEFINFSPSRNKSNKKSVPKNFYNNKHLRCFRFFYISTSIKIEINSILVIPNCPRIPTKKYLTSADFFIKNNFHKILLLIFSDFWFFFCFSQVENKIYGKYFVFVDKKNLYDYYDYFYCYYFVSQTIILNWRENWKG